MATAQLMRPAKTTTSMKQQVNQFTKQFPNATKSYTDSELFVKQLIAMSISHISHLYKMFSEDIFEERSLAGVTIKVLRPKLRENLENHDEAYQLVSWIKGAYDALKKKYLKSLILGISTPENREGEVSESFTYNFSYSAEAVTMITGDGGKEVVDPKRTIEGILQSTVSLFNTSTVAVSSTHNADNLSNLTFSMKLLYNEGTPEDYEPPYFQPSLKKQFDFPSKPTVLQLGSIATPFHGMDLLMRIPKENKLTMEVKKKPPTPHFVRPKNGKQQQPMDTADENQQPEECSQESSVSFWDNAEALSPKMPFEKMNSQMYGDLPPAMSPGHPASAVSTTGSRADLPHKGRIRCPCLNELLEGTLLCCSECGHWQHALCFGVLCEKKLEQHVCEICAERGTEDCTDARLAREKDLEALQELCLYRNALVVCMRVTRVNNSTMEEHLDVSDEMNGTLLKKLQDDGVLVSKKGRIDYNKSINREKLKLLINDYFQYTETDNDGVGSATKALKNLSTSPAKKPRKSFTPPTYDMLRESALSGLQASRLNLKRGKSPASKSHDKSPAPKKFKASDPVNKKVIKRRN